MFGLLFPPVLLLSGAGLLIANPTTRWPWQRWAALVVVSLALVGVLVSPGVEGRVWELTQWSDMPVLTPPVVMQTNNAGQTVGLALLATALAAALVGARRPVGNTRWAATLASLAAGLLALLAANLLTLVLCWTLLDGVLLVAWVQNKERRALLGWAAGALGTLLLWAATLPLQATYGLQAMGGLSLQGSVGTALLLAALLRLAPFPFHLAQVWIGGSDSEDPVVDNATDDTHMIVLHALPAATGIWLLARITGWLEVEFVWRQIISALLLTGLVGSGLLAWLGNEPRQAMRWVLTGQAGLVVLAALWAGPEAALAEGGVFLLAASLFPLLTRLETLSPESRISGGIGVAALAGLPLTWGAAGRFALYGSWLEGRWGLNLLLATGAQLLFLATAGRLLVQRSASAADRHTRILTGVALGLTAAALLFVGGGLPRASALVWVAVLVPPVGAALIAWGAQSHRLVRQEVATWINPVLRLDWVTQLLRALARWVGRPFLAMHDVLEGEGVLLWVLVLLALGWLLLTASSSG